MIKAKQIQIKKYKMLLLLKKMNKINLQIKIMEEMIILGMMILSNLTKM